MHYRFFTDTSIPISVLVHRNIEIRIGLTAKQVAENGLDPSDEGHTLICIERIAATRIVKTPEDLKEAVEAAEQMIGASAADRYGSLDEIAAVLWPDL